MRFHEATARVLSTRNAPLVATVLGLHLLARLRLRFNALYKTELKERVENFESCLTAVS